MKSHRPWQPHMSTPPLFNPFAPVTDRASTLDHIDLSEEETETSDEQSEQEREDASTFIKRD